LIGPLILSVFLRLIQMTGLFIQLFQQIIEKILMENKNERRS